MESNRREFLKKLALTTASLPILQYNLSADNQKLIEGKEKLNLLNDRPLILEASQSLLDDEITPTDKIFVRNNGIIPPIAYEKDPKDWRLLIDGEVDKTVELSLNDLKTKFKNYEYQLVLECGGNGRAAYFPKTEGTQWTYGGVACPLWLGVRLKDILEYVGVKKTAVYVAYYAHDIHLSGDSKKDTISRGFPIAKGLDEMTMIAFGVNGKALPPYHGFPARLICPGYPASASGKWLKRLWIRKQIHDGAKMTGKSYRVPSYPIAPGMDIPERDFKIIEEMPVKSLITFPKSGSKFKWDQNSKFVCRGFAWSGSGDVEEVHISHNFGQTWIKAKLKKPRNKFAWQRWDCEFSLPSKGYYEIYARATDKNGNSQPMLVPSWNPEGYLNNATPRIAVYAEV